MKFAFLFIIAGLVILNACGAFKHAAPTRSIASVDLSLKIDADNFETSLKQMHIYYVMAQKQMMNFDRMTEKLETYKRYSSPSYLKLQAIKSQVGKIEAELYESLKEDESLEIGLSAINKFAAISTLHAYSVENLLGRFSASNESSKRVTKSEIEKEISLISSSPDYQVFEQNIEHLSFMLETRGDETSKKFHPSSTVAGNIYGDEFPSKVWAITFDDGPQKEISGLILKELNSSNLTATFFQTVARALDNKPTARIIRKSGMEIASNGYTSQQLTKVAGNGLEKEISSAVKELSQLHNVLIKFFRLPLGSGVTDSKIREKIAENDLIHVMWNVDSLDWVPQPAEQVSERTINLMNKTGRDSGIILLHDTYLRTARALPKIMNHLKRQNRRVCTISVITEQMNKGLETVCP